jgi:hypothetical protein
MKIPVKSGCRHRSIELGGETCTFDLDEETGALMLVTTEEACDQGILDFEQLMSFLATPGLTQSINTLTRIRRVALGKIKEAETAESLAEVRVEFLGKTSELSNILHGLSGVAPSIRPLVGGLGLRIKNFLQSMAEKQYIHIEELARLSSKRAY